MMGVILKTARNNFFAVTSACARFAWMHFLFDILAFFCGAAAALWQKKFLKLPEQSALNGRYLTVLITGVVLGGYGFGTGNLLAGHVFVLAHSILGALAGGIIAIELYKAVAGIRQATGVHFALPFCVAAAVGRIGCFLTGLEDMTYGTPTALPWAVDFGDGIPRHPVQLYESLAMALCAVALVVFARRWPDIYPRFAFPAAVGFYGAQRFIWEGLKPYAPVFGPFNLFHLLCVALVLYSFSMIFIRARHGR